MAYMSQERKAKIAPVVKAILKKYGVKGSLSVRNHMTLCLTIKSGAIDFIGNYNSFNIDNPRYASYGGFTPAKDYIDVNPYWYHEHFNGVAKNCLKEIIQAMNAGNHDNSDAMVDYFDVGWYIDVNIGRWNKPYVLEK